MSPFWLYLSLNLGNILSRSFNLILPLFSNEEQPPKATVILRKLKF